MIREGKAEARLSKENWLFHSVLLIDRTDDAHLSQLPTVIASLCQSTRRSEAKPIFTNAFLKNWFLTIRNSINWSVKEE